MEIDRYEPGVPSWVDLGSPDPQGAADFYGALFGWDAPEGPPETGGYRVAWSATAPSPGIGPQQNPGPPVWATTSTVESADDAAQKVDRGRRAGDRARRWTCSTSGAWRCSPTPSGAFVLGLASRDAPGRASW